MNAPATKNPVVLVIDDEIQMRKSLRGSLERNGYEVREAATGNQGLDEAVLCRPDAVLLDLELPDMDGLAVLKHLREWTQVPVLVVSVRAQEDDKINALDSGADDYITKPFSTRELLARLRVTRRRAQSAEPPPIFRSGRLKVDLTKRTVTVEGKKVKLTATEYSLLRLLVQHSGKVLTHSHILHEIWGLDDTDKISYLRVYISYLREKLEIQPREPELIVTETGVGYRLVQPE